ncbi:MAG: response regulator transcription factor [Bacteroidetes bacterium]|nr:response regulator transcription factor [Bacteroidota bacterium]
MGKDTLINIALVEDNPINRSTFMNKMPLLYGCNLLFVAQNGYDCLEQLKGLPVQKIPKVIFMDLEMPQLNGIQTISMAHALYPEICFIVLTVFDDDDKIFEAIKSGASGYLLKHEPATVLADAIANVLEFGGAPMSPAIARKALNLLSKAPLDSGLEKETSIPVSITQREQQILQHTINGWDAKRIAGVLDLSVLTVRKHIANIYAKLHVKSKAEVISIAHKEKWFK